MHSHSYSHPSPPISHASHSSTSDSTCYFSIVPSPSTHYSTETPIPTPLQVACYSSEVFSDPSNPLLAIRYHQVVHPLADMESSNLLQLQTGVAHGSRSSSSTPPQSNCSSPPQELVCVRCRRTCYGNVVKFGKSSYQVYCRHCADMVGFKDSS